MSSNRLEVEGHGSVVRFYSPYSSTLVERIKSDIPPSGRKPGFNQAGKFTHWEVSSAHVAILDKMCLDIFREVPEHTGRYLKPEPKVYTLFVEYMGLIRDRGNEVYSATGWVADGWNATFPAIVLAEWFNFNITVNKPSRPQEKDKRDAYTILGIKRNADSGEIKKAYRRAARTWHPDVCKEEGATQQFQAIQVAYGKIGDPIIKFKYDAWLSLEGDIEAAEKGAKTRDKKPEKLTDSNVVSWRPPVRCGTVRVRAIESMEKYTIEKILAWDDIEKDGKTMVSSWDMGSEKFKVRWVR